MGVLASAFGRDEHAGQAVVSGGDQACFGVVGCGENGKAILAQFLGDAAHALAGNTVGLDGAVDDEDRELEVLVHQVATSEGHGVHFRVVEPCIACTGPFAGEPAPTGHRSVIGHRPS
ncbi:hypothetical protein D9M71_478120 [compost metagenome]